MQWSTYSLVNIFRIIPEAVPFPNRNSTQTTSYQFYGRLLVPYSMKVKNHIFGFRELITGSIPL